MTILVTRRMTLLPQVAGDAPALFDILGDPLAMRFWNHAAITRLAMVEELIREQQAAMANGVCRYWTVFEKGDAIGSVDLSMIEGRTAELGFVLRPDRWGQGLATEAAAAVVAHGWGVLNLVRLAAAVQSGNAAAARVLEKTGFRLAERHSQVLLPGGIRRDCAFYLLER
ncbi:MAG TPA: GNAT family N-acetyltransferase [Rhizomicrobium sp.]|nr:GNAT family N-acetyltransferase [Rhizomicrobium sp.]